MREGRPYDSTEEPFDMDYAKLIREQLLFEFDIAYLYLAEVHLENSVKLYHETLMTFNDFDQDGYKPLVDPIKYPLQYF